MGVLSIEKLRGLQQIAGPDGIFTICAMDHRGSFRSMINPDNPTAVSYDEMVRRKLELCSEFAGLASAVLIDPLFGAAPCIGQGVLPRDTGLLVSVEATGYGGAGENRTTHLLDDWGVDKIKRMGAPAVKILVYYRPDQEGLAAAQLNTVRTVANQCVRHDIPFLVEPVSYPVGSEVGDSREFAMRKAEIVIRTAGEMTALPIDVLKAEFPADLRYLTDRQQLLATCRQLDGATRVPWVILSAGVDFEAFAQQVEIACQAGASGFLGGRAIWQEVMEIDDTGERAKFLATTGADRLKRLNNLARKHAVPWYRKYGVSPDRLADVSEDWYRSY